MTRSRPLRILPVVVALLLAPACESPAPPRPRPEQVLRVRMRENPPHVDPAQGADTLSDRVNLAVHDGLVDFEPESLDIVPAVAERWEIAPDGLRYTFHLRPGARFHNGREVTAGDVVYSLTRLLDPAVKSPHHDMLEAVQGTEDFTSGRSPSVRGLVAADPRTVVIHLDRPVAYLLQLLATPATSVIPREVYDDPGRGYLARPVGCGPFRVSRWERSQFLELEAFDDYYRGRPRLDRILVRFIENPATALEEYRAGGLEWLDEMVGSESALAREFPSDYRRAPFLATLYFGLNLARPPFEGNVELRRAFNYAVNREALCSQVFEGTLTPGGGILPPGIPGFNPDLPGYRYDPDRARASLARAGYPGGKGLPGIDLWVNNNQKMLEAAQRVQSDLRAVGIPVQVRPSDFAAYLEALRGTAETPGEARFYRYGWQADYPDPDAFLYWLLHSRNRGPAGNIARYSNPRVDDLLDRARALTRMEDRIPLYREAERIAVVEDAAWLFLASYTQRVLIKPYVKGVVLSPLGSGRIPLERLHLEPAPAAESR